MREADPFAVFDGADAREPAVSHPRVLVVAEEDSESSVVETYAGGDGAMYLTNAVTEIFAAKNARDGS